MVIASGATPEFIGLNTSEPPFAFLPKPAGVFRDRAARFRILAPGHVLAPYLSFIATLVEAQDRLAAYGVEPFLDALVVERAFAHGMPPIPKELSQQPDFALLLEALVGDLAHAGLDDGPKAALDRLVALDSAARSELVTAVGQGAFPLEQLAEAAIVAAALQVWFARAAAQLDAKRLKTVEEGVCPGVRWGARRQHDRRLARSAYRALPLLLSLQHQLELRAGQMLGLRGNENRSPIAT